MGLKLMAVVVGLVLVAGACSSSDSEVAADQAPPSTTPTTEAGTAAPANASTTTAADDPEPAPAGGGSGAATVTLTNGEAFTFSILCALEPQEAAGQEILFSAVSYDTPFGFDVTQFGKSTAGFDDHGSISICDAETYDDVWGASSTTAQLSTTDFALSLDGTTITGSGMFFTGEDVANLELSNGVPGDLVADCG